MFKNKGFTLVEILIAVGVLALIAGIVFIALANTRTKAGDNLRIAELDRLGRVLQTAGGSLGNYLTGLPSSGDLNVLFDEIEIRSGNKIFGQRPKDPSVPDPQSGFGYIISGSDIVIYANLQNREAEVTLPHNAPTPGGGNGTLQGTDTWAMGLNNTDRYYQVSN